MDTEKNVNVTSTELIKGVSDLKKSIEKKSEKQPKLAKTAKTNYKSAF